LREGKGELNGQKTHPGNQRLRADERKIANLGKKEII